MRSWLGHGVALVVGAFGAVVLGEYALDGWLALLSGLLLGLLVGEATLAVVRRPRPVHTVTCALASIGGMSWALWISLGHRLGDATTWGWAAVVVAGLAGALRARPTEPVPDSRPEPEPSPPGSRRSPHQG